MAGVWIVGSSHLFGVLPALGLPTAYETLVYLVAFGMSSIFAMTGFAWGIGRLIQRVGHRGNAVLWIMNGSASAAVVIGCIWLVS